MTYAGHMAFQVIRNRNSKGAGFPSLQTAGFVTVNTIVIFFGNFQKIKFLKKKLEKIFLKKKKFQKKNILKKKNLKKFFEKKILKKNFLEKKF